MTRILKESIVDDCGKQKKKGQMKYFYIRFKENKYSEMGGNHQNCFPVQRNLLVRKRFASARANYFRLEKTHFSQRECTHRKLRRKSKKRSALLKDMENLQSEFN